MRCETLLDDLKRFRPEILTRLSLRDCEHFRLYCLVQQKHAENELDDQFRRKFCSFYRMNGPSGLNDSQKRHFFKLMSLKESNLSKILKELCLVPGFGGRQRVFLSFGTKLLHTLDTNQPIYDRNIAHVLKLPRLTFQGSCELKIENRLRIYEELKSCFEVLLENEKILDYLRKVRTALFDSASGSCLKQDGRLISDAKLLDSVLWALYANL